MNTAATKYRNHQFRQAPDTPSYTQIRQMVADMSTHYLLQERRYVTRNDDVSPAYARAILAELEAREA